jgi:hypothetical protein
MLNESQIENYWFYRTIGLILDSLSIVWYVEGKRPQRFGDWICLPSTYQTMDRVQNKPNSSVQHTPSSESFQVYLIGFLKYDSS